MRSKLVKRLFFGTALTLWSASLWQIVNAQSSTQNLVMAPFIASESIASPNFVAQVASTGKRSPYFLRKNKTDVAVGTYNGIVITPESKEGMVPLSDLSMDVKGDINALAVVNYSLMPTKTRGAMHKELASLNLSAISKSAVSKDGYQKILINHEQLGIPSNNLMSNIVIAQSPERKSGNLFIDDVKVNMASVRKAMDTLFFDVEGGSPTGPIGSTAVSGPGNLKKTYSPTGLVVKNGTSSQVTVWATLPTVCTSGSTCILSVQDIFPNMTCVPGGCFQGYQTIQGYDSISYAPSANPSAIEGVLISFNAAPNCQVTVGEATLNNNSQSIPGFAAQETADVSIVNGNNASIKISLSRGGGEKWTTNYGKLAYSAAFQNYAGSNLNLPGVFPFLCTNCTASISPPSCGTLTDGCNTPCTTDASKPVYKTCPQVCTFQRDATKTGGTVTMTYLGAPQPMPTQPLKDHHR